MHVSGAVFATGRGCDAGEAVAAAGEDGLSAGLCACFSVGHGVDGRRGGGEREWAERDAGRGRATVIGLAKITHARTRASIFPSHSLPPTSSTD